MAIEFTNKPTKWENDGAEPSTELKKNGFQAGYKPPAGIFNHHWSESAKCIEELQNKLSDVDDKKMDKGSGKGLSTNDYTNAEKAEVAKIADKVDKVSGKGLSSNDYTNAEKAEVAKIADKVDKVSGKGLSSNDYTNAEKAEVAKIADKVDKVSGKGLSSNDFTSAYKSKLDSLDTNLGTKAAKTEVITKTNTSAFTPTGDYNPATKKYVDDNTKTKVINGSNLSSLTLTISTTIPTTLAAGTICFIPEA